jgi:glycosyltransferase involved in cell wall biosynthesis
VLAPAYVTVLAIARLRGKSVVLTLHNVHPHEGGRLRRIANGVVLPLAHRIVVHTERNRQALLARGFAAGRIDVVPMGVNTLSAPRPTRNEARRVLGLVADAPITLFFGNIRTYKGVDVLLDAFDDVHMALPDAVLVIVGQPWKDAAGVEERLRHALPNVVSRLGYVSDQEMASYYAAADVVVYPYTQFDAQSAAACDAIQYGRAIVVTDAGGLPELVGEPEAVVRAGDAKSLARAIVCVLTDDALRTRLETGAARRSLECSWDTTADRTVSAYRALRRSPATMQTTSERA